MPPWGAIKGFGEFRNDQALTQEQIELIVDWIQNDAPRGNNRRALPADAHVRRHSAISVAGSHDAGEGHRDAARSRWCSTA